MGTPASSGPPPAGVPLARVLGIAAGARVALLHAPDGIEATLAPLPEGVRLQHGLRRSDRVDLIVGFVTERDHVDRNLDWLLPTLTPTGAFWVAWPQPASGVATDLTADGIRQLASSRGRVAGKELLLDDTWSALELLPAPPPSSRS